MSKLNTEAGNVAVWTTERNLLAEINYDINNYV